MPFDLGFNFRGSSNGVSDPLFAVPVFAEVYPHTYTNGNGVSISAGWDSVTGITAYDRDNSNDPRITGMNFRANDGSPKYFQIDLSSGAAPGAGTYAIDLACGDPNAGHPQDFKVLDTATLLIDGTNGGSGFTTLADHYIDATLADVTATTTWTGTPVNKVFATTLVKVGICFHNIGDGTCLTHFRLTLTTVAATSLLPPPTPYRHLLVR